MIVETIEKLEEGFNDKVLIDIIGGSITELFFKKVFLILDLNDNLKNLKMIK